MATVVAGSGHNAFSHWLKCCGHCGPFGSQVLAIHCSRECSAGRGPPGAGAFRGGLHRLVLQVASQPALYLQLSAKIFELRSLDPKVRMVLSRFTLGSYSTKNNLYTSFLSRCLRCQAFFGLLPLPLLLPLQHLRCKAWNRQLLAAVDKAGVSSAGP